MKVKYFIRGLGIGILITAIILGLSYKSKNSDEDVILRAKKLGMVFAEDVSGSAIELDGVKTSEPVVKDEAAATPDPTNEPAAEQTEEPKNEPTDEPAEKETSKPSKKSDKSDKKNTDNKVKFSIKGGDLASSVSKQLEKLGIIKDAKEFNRYLSDNGYSVRVRVGEYTAEKGMSYEEIAKMISR